MGLGAFRLEDQEDDGDDEEEEEEESDEDSERMKRILDSRSPYEQLRESNICRNNSVLAQLGFQPDKVQACKIDTKHFRNEHLIH